MTVLNSGEFDDFDNEVVYADSLGQATDQHARNFVVQFGKAEAQVAFNLNYDKFKALLEGPMPAERPVRWINIWAPDQQADVVNMLGERYDFSPRLLAIMRTEPPEIVVQEERTSRFRRKQQPVKEADMELAEVVVTSAESYKGRSRKGVVQTEISHYTLAEQMINFQSIDFGTRYLCIGANWMHTLARVSEDIEIAAEGEQRRLWSWLVLCDDHTVISVHEDPGETPNPEDVKSIRANTLSVLKQLSERGRGGSLDPISMQTVRQALKDDVDELGQGMEGSSLLFYYLFDDWRAVFRTVAMYKQRLGELRTIILGDIGRKSISTPRVEIIPRLHVLGGQIRQSQHLYEGYKNLIDRALRALEPKSTGAVGFGTPRTLSNLGQTHRGVIMAKSASQRFERLGDRLELLILSKTKEFLDEKDALISTYFNINAQKDSEATARLTRSATLLAKLSVLFLPVSLMTSYFSVQISDLTGVYTSKDYWSAFAVLMSISFLFVFFFGRLLMWVTETLDANVKSASKACSKYFAKKFKKGDARKKR